MTRAQEVLIFVRRGDEFLALHRSPENDAYWHSVAGGVEEGETYAAAAVRELREETGLAAEPQPLESTFVYGGITVECFVVEAPDEGGPEPAWGHTDTRGG